ncbi:hypothetical protein FHW79_006077 [Azospirillum sp. OGB3]|uniref:type IV secretion system protein n=1 Tax=Azospirillum sp. OGB3 TaxID=2587012 RepID=UPI001605C7E1|nr:type IV secretion system protein [Azospirillum sp. OGB3]MBB3268402.1 hypothetical protein [Azospirillum sp. OGB3]
MFTELYTLGFGTGTGGFARTSFDALVGPANAFARLLATYLVVWTMLQFMLYEEATREFLKRSLKLIAVLIGIGFFLSRGGATWMFETVIVGMQTTALSVAQTIIGKGVELCGGAPSAGGGGTYAALWYGVECVGFSPIRTAAENWARLSGLDAIAGLADMAAWGLLALPYLFVLGVFGAFLLQAMFYFLALSGTAPVILLFLVFDATRGILWSGLKLLLTGALTIIFAGMAMGFTGSVLSKYAGNVAAYQAYAIGVSSSTCVADAVAKEQASGRNPFSLWSGTLKQIEANCDKKTAENAAAQAQSAADMAADKLCFADHFVCTKSYWAAFLIGLMSVLLHLLAPKIAANLSGASDSAATAAAVVGAGQFAAAKMMGWGRNSASWMAGTAGRVAGLAFGRTGLGGAAQSLANTFGSGGVREQVQQTRMIDSLNQLSLGINALNQSLAKRGKDE